MNPINFKKEINGDLETVIAKVTAQLKEQGFGVLNRIDLHSKIKEKIGKELRPIVILGACHPQLAYEAYLANTDVASLLPCNAVIREVADGRFSVELAKPTALMRMLGDENLVSLAGDADKRLESALNSMG
jgi:uncharacterized protein (DUF302 family)